MHDINRIKGIMSIYTYLHFVIHKPCTLLWSKRAASDPHAVKRVCTHACFLVPQYKHLSYATHIISAAHYQCELEILGFA